jgi:hypothetical protein
MALQETDILYTPKCVRWRCGRPVTGVGDTSLYLCR